MCIVHTLYDLPAYINIGIADVFKYRASKLNGNSV